MLGKKRYANTSEAIDSFVGGFKEIAEKQAKIVDEEREKIINAEEKKIAAEQEMNVAIRAAENLNHMFTRASDGFVSEEG